MSSLSATTGLKSAPRPRFFSQAGWPGGVLPTWHVGAVEGEGGMDGKMLRHFYDAVQAAAVSAHGAHARDPRVSVHGALTVGMYNGINAKDAAIADVVHNLVAHDSGLT